MKVEEMFADGVACLVDRHRDARNTDGGKTVIVKMLSADLELLGRELGDETRRQIEKANASLEARLDQALERLEHLEAQQRRAMKDGGVIDWQSAKRSA